MIESKSVKPSDRYEQPTILMHNNEVLEDEARLAMALIERWGMVAGIPDGEDSAGRSKLRLATPDDLVDRAMTCAKIAYEKAREAGLVFKTESIHEID